MQGSDSEVLRRVSRLGSLLALLMLLQAGCQAKNDRLYCAECKEIRLLQAKEKQTTADMDEIKRLQKKLGDKARGIAAFHRAGGEPTIELHPGCDCPCHFVAL